MANLNRRAALIGAVASTASLSLPAISLVRAKEPETIPDLAQRISLALEQDGGPWRVVVTADGHRIDFMNPSRVRGDLDKMLDRRRNAEAAFEVAASALEEAEARVDKLGRMLVPVCVIANAGYDRERYDLWAHGPGFIEERIRGTHDRRRSINTTEEVDASLATCLSALTKACEERERQEQACGLPDAAARYDEAYEEWNAARLAILGYVPVSPTESASKAAWLRETYDNDRIEPDELEALIASIAGKAVA